MSEESVRAAVEGIEPSYGSSSISLDLLHCISLWKRPVSIQAEASSDERPQVLGRR